MAGCKNLLCRQLAARQKHFGQPCSNHTNTEHCFRVCLQVFHQAGPPQRVDWSGVMGNKRKVCFTRAQRRISSSRIEPGASDLSITTQTLYQLSYQISITVYGLANGYHHLHHMLDPIFSPSTELAGFRMVIVFTIPRHFVRSHASSFPSQFFFISLSSCFFHVCVGLPLPLLPLTSIFKAFTITFSSFFLKT